MPSLIEQFAGDEGGATAIEYGLIAALIAVAAIVAMTTLGNGLAGLFAYTSDKANTAWTQAATQL